tara:strand:- start:2156 stop:2689 length:534 start_codon:yes stop_codon:yes gene_type:complete
MSENAQNEPNENGVIDSPVSKDDKKDYAVPSHRFNEVISERNKLRQEMEAFKADKEQARAKALEEQGNFETLLTEERNKNVKLGEQFNSTSEQLNSYITDEKNRLLSKLPEEKRERYEQVDVLTLRNLVDDFSVEKQNMKKAESGTGRTTVPVNPFKEMGKNEKRKNWNDILNSYKK